MGYEDLGNAARQVVDAAAEEAIDGFVTDNRVAALKAHTFSFIRPKPGFDAVCEELCREQVIVGRPELRGWKFTPAAVAALASLASS